MNATQIKSALAILAAKDGATVARVDCRSKVAHIRMPDGAVRHMSFDGCPRIAMRELSAIYNYAKKYGTDLRTVKGSRYAA